MKHIYTDGSCRANGKENPVGGWGVVVLDDNKHPIHFEQLNEVHDTTNNRMEMSAIIYAMLMYGKDAEAPIVYTDSAYAYNTFTNWMYNWEKRGWIKSDNKTPENLDIVKQYFNLEQKGYKIKLEKVKGHSTNEWNNMADELATGVLNKISAIKKYVKGDDSE